MRHLIFGLCFLLLSSAVGFSQENEPASKLDVVPAYGSGSFEADDSKSMTDAITFDTQSSLPSALLDPAFDRYVDLVQLGVALREADADYVLDAALELANGERILLRTHKSGVTAKGLLVKASRLAANEGNQDALNRLVVAAQRLQDKDTLAQIEAAQRLVGASRASNPLFTVSVEITNADTLIDLKGWLDVVRKSESFGDRPVLELLREELLQAERLSPEQRDAITKRIDQALDGISDPSSDDAILQVLAGGSRTDSDRQSVRDRIEGGGWYIVWGKTVAAREYAELVAATASGSLGPYFSYLLEANIEKMQRQLQTPSSVDES